MIAETIYIIDGSLESLLTAIFEYYERKPPVVTIVLAQHYQPSTFELALMVQNDTAKADRVWKGLSKRMPKNWLHRFFGAFLSEQREIYDQLFRFACYVFDHPQGATANFGNEYVLAIAQMDRKVHREKHRMEAFIRFRKTEDGMFLAHVDPDFNVLPLIVKHFRNRYADQPWIIYDLRRKYGIHYDLKTVTEVTLDFAENEAENSLTAALPFLDEKEELYARLWKDYFKSTNIPARKNMKLHIQHVPKRYWKYLTEKEVLNA